MISLKKTDNAALYFIGIILAYSAVIFIVAYLSGEDMSAWVWERHQNLFSWYSRPLFIIPAAYYAYRRKLWHVIGFMALLATSLFWFDEPATVPLSVREYLQWERQFFITNDNKLPLIALVICVFIFLFSMFYAFWQRNLWYGLAAINFGTIFKIIVSVAFGQSAGMAAIAPSLSSLLVINLLAWFLIRRSRDHNSL